MKTKLLTMIILTGLLLSSCQSDYTQQDSVPVLKLDQTININGLEREYHIQIPIRAC